MAVQGFSDLAQGLLLGSCMSAYPVTVDVVFPSAYSRAQLALRLVLLLAIGMVGASFGLLVSLLYLLLPALAAVALTNEPADSFMTSEAIRLTKVLNWILAVMAYFALVTDRFPTTAASDVTLHLQPSGRPTSASALLRIVYGLPSALVLALFGCLAAVAWLVAALFVLIQGTYPSSIRDLQVSALRWAGRLLAYQASLVEPYPPFSFGFGDNTPPSTTLPGAP